MALVETSTAGGDLWLRDQLGHPVGVVLTKVEAMEVTAKIQAYAGVAWILLYEAHRRQAHKALGYATWAEYVETEFDMSRGYSYRLISQARVVIEISEAAGVSPMGDITERQARDIEPILAEVVAEVSTIVDALPADASEADKQDATRAVINDKRKSKIVPRPAEPEGPSGSDQASDIPAAGSGDDDGNAPEASGGQSDPSPTPKVGTHRRAAAREGHRRWPCALSTGPREVHRAVDLLRRLPRRRGPRGDPGAPRRRDDRRPRRDREGASMTEPTAREMIPALLDRCRPDRYDPSDKGWQTPVIEQVAFEIPAAEARSIVATSMVAKAEGTATKRTNRLLREIAQTGGWPLDWFEAMAWPLALDDHERVTLRAARPVDLDRFALRERKAAQVDFTSRNAACEGAAFIAAHLGANSLRVASDIKPGLAA